MSDIGVPAQDDSGQPGIRILAQYIRDLSFETPHEQASRPSGSNPSTSPASTPSASHRAKASSSATLRVGLRGRNPSPSHRLELQPYGLVLQFRGQERQMRLAFGVGNALDQWSGPQA